MPTTKGSWGPACPSSCRNTLQSLLFQIALLRFATHIRHYTPLGPAMGHLQHGTLLLGICAKASKTRHTTTLAWTPSHLERTKAPHEWTEHDRGIHTADTLAGSSADLNSAIIRTFYCDLEALHAALTPQWQADGAPFHGSLKQRAQQFQFRL